MPDTTTHRAPGEWEEHEWHSWLRETDEPYVRNVEVKGNDEDGWQVDVWAANIVRTDPVERTLRERLFKALSDVDGVDEVLEEDREIWSVEGQCSPERLLTVACAVVDEMAADIRPFTVA